MPENTKIGALCAALLTVGIWGSAVDLQLAAKAERQARAADILVEGLEDCVPAPAMVLNYAGCGSKAYRTKAYFASRVQALASAE